MFLTHAVINESENPGQAQTRVDSTNYCRIARFPTFIYEVEMECGRVVVRRVDDDDDGTEDDEDAAAVEIGLPELVRPGFSEFVMFEKQVGA